MDLYANEGELDESERIENLDSILEETEPDLEQEVNAVMDADIEENGNLEEDEIPEDVDSPRTPQQSSKKGKFLKRKRKRSSSEESSTVERGVDAGTKVRGPLSNTNKEINVGTDFQAVIDEEFDNKNYKNYIEDRDEPDELIWDTPNVIDKEKLAKFIEESAARYLIPIDRALFILTQNKFDFDTALAKIVERNELKDTWTDDEIALFDNCYYIFGKNFSQIRSALCHRSLQSIIRYYYDSKKRLKYRQFATSTSKLNDTFSSEETEPHSPYPEEIFDAMCENCGEKAEKLQLNDAMNRTECRACLIYFNIMGVPRPTSLRLVLSERIKNHVACPENMKEYMKDFDKLTGPATGSTYLVRKMGQDQTVEDIIGVNKTPTPSPTMVEKVHNHNAVDDTLSNPVDSTEISSEPTKVAIEPTESSNEPSEVQPESSGDTIKSPEVDTGRSETAVESSEVPITPPEVCEKTIADPSEVRADPSDVAISSPEADTKPSEILAETSDIHADASVVTTQSADASLHSSDAPIEQSESNIESSKAPMESAEVFTKPAENTTEECSSALAEPLDIYIKPEINDGLPVMRIWNHRRTVCMEEMEILADDSRRKMYDACQHASRVNTKEIATWKNEMAGLRNRIERTNIDIDLNPSFLFSQERVYYSQDWTEHEKEEVMKCFHWYGSHFEQIADVLGTKTAEQIYKFYVENQKLIDETHDDFQQEMNNKLVTSPNDTKTMDFESQ